jgi:CBS domain-containing protein
MPTAGEFCSRRVVIAKKGDSLVEAARRMRDEHVGSLVVVEDEDGGKRIPIGVLTDRDIVVGVVATNPDDLPRLMVGDVIVGELIKAWEDDDLADTLKRMRSYGVRRIPVLGRDGELVGLVSFDDIVEYLSEEVNDLATLLSREQSREHQVRP